MPDIKLSRWLHHFRRNHRHRAGVRVSAGLTNTQATMVNLACLLIPVVIVLAIAGLAHIAQAADDNAAAANPAATFALPDPARVEAAPLPSPHPTPPPWVDLPDDQDVQWALVSADGNLTGSPEREKERTSTESMIKAWLAADFLRTHPDPTEIHKKQIRDAIRWSDDADAQSLYEQVGLDASILRMIDMCGLRNTVVVDGWWSLTQMTAADAARLGVCLVSGTAAGVEWTPWLMDLMRDIRGEGRFGIVDGLPDDLARQVAYKNGWTRHSASNSWVVTCLAVTNTWVLSVMQRYPADLGLDHGAKVCADVARQLHAQDRTPPPVTAEQIAAQTVSR